MIDLRLKPGETVRLCAHRGGLATAPENTLAALRQAKARGAAACEIDIRLSGDGHLVLMHDADVTRTTDGVGLVEDMTLPQLQALDAGGRFGWDFVAEPVPTLIDAIRLARDAGLILRVEIKDYDRNPRLVAALGQVLDAIGDAPPIVLCSFDLVQLRDLKPLFPDIATMGIVHVRAADFRGLVEPARLNGLSVQPDLFTAEDAHDLHDAGCAISCFAPLTTTHDAPGAQNRRRAARIRALAREGLVDMVTGDDVTHLLALV